MDEQKPRTLAEMETAANSGAASPWMCPRCGGNRWWVRNSYYVMSDGTKHRRRECRQCHQTIYTREEVTE